MYRYALEMIARGSPSHATITTRTGYPGVHPSRSRPHPTSHSIFKKLPNGDESRGFSCQYIWCGEADPDPTNSSSSPLTSRRRPGSRRSDRFVMLDRGERVVEVVQEPTPLLVFLGPPKSHGVILETVPLDQQQVPGWRLDAPFEPNGSAPGH